MKTHIHTHTHTHTKPPVKTVPLLLLSNVPSGQTNTHQGRQLAYTLAVQRNAACLFTLNLSVVLIGQP